MRHFHKYWFSSHILTVFRFMRLNSESVLRHECVAELRADMDGLVTGGSDKHFSWQWMH